LRCGLACDSFEEINMTIRLLTAAAVLVYPALSSAQTPTPKPNIVVILADDLGYADIGCYGSEIRTPNLNGLAKKGLRFTNFFNTARCCPSRASLMTGLYSHQAGVGHMTDNLKLPGYQGQLNRNCVTIAELLRTAGYRNYMVGKWHLSSNASMKAPNETWPTKRGFDRFFGTIPGGGNYFAPHGLVRDHTPIEPAKESFYYTDAISDTAVEFVRDHKKDHAGTPFFMYVAYTAPHWPLHALKEDIARYRGKYREGWDVMRQRRHKKMVELGIIDAKWKVGPSDAPPFKDLTPEQIDDLDFRMAIYAAQVDRMDQGIGKIIATLEKERMLDNTLVMFMADNGACAEIIERGMGGELGGRDSFSSYGVGWAWFSNGFLRLFKHWVHGGGVSSPLIVHWPARIPPASGGQLRRQYGHLIDIMATCADVSGAKYPAMYNGNKITPLEGTSLVPAFADKAIERDAIYWEHEGNKAILVGHWKLVSKHPGPWELYNLKEDRGETSDLAQEHPGRTKDLAARWQVWAERSQVLPMRAYVKDKKKKK
jgi:arylsulfatase A-like enzyme